MLKRIPRSNDITTVLRELHLLKIHDIIILLILLLTHNAVNKSAPEYLSDLIRFNVKCTTIRTRASFDLCLLCVPQLVKCVIIHSLSDHLCMLALHCGLPLI